MIFTREDILKILNALLQLGRKDSEFKDANVPLNSNDEIAILQDGINKKVSINNLLSTLGLLKKDDFINVSDRYDEYYIQLSEAITIIANNKRKKGLVITFQDLQGNWKIFQFNGELNNFINTSYWKDLEDFKYPIINSILPDEEDLTLTLPDINNNTYIKLKDRDYDILNFSGKATKILRKNIKEIDGERKNILIQDDFNKENCIYEIRYDFDLNSETITIPSNCILNFIGGSIYNGTLNFNGSIIKGNIQIDCNILNLGNSIVYAKGLNLENNRLKSIIESPYIKGLYLEPTTYTLYDTVNINNPISIYGNNATIFFDNKTAQKDIRGFYILGVNNNDDVYKTGYKTLLFKDLNIILNYNNYETDLTETVRIEASKNIIIDNCYIKCEGQKTVLWLHDSTCNVKVINSTLYKDLSEEDYEKSTHVGGTFWLLDYNGTLCENIEIINTTLLHKSDDELIAIWTHNQNDGILKNVSFTNCKILEFFVANHPRGIGVDFTHYDSIYFNNCDITLTAKYNFLFVHPNNENFYILNNCRLNCGIKDNTIIHNSILINPFRDATNNIYIYDSIITSELTGLHGINYYFYNCLFYLTSLDDFALLFSKDITNLIVQNCKFYGVDNNTGIHTGLFNLYGLGTNKGIIIIKDNYIKSEGANSAKPILKFWNPALDKRIVIENNIFDVAIDTYIQCEKNVIIKNNVFINKLVKSANSNFAKNKIVVDNYSVNTIYRNGENPFITDNLPSPSKSLLGEMVYYTTSKTPVWNIGNSWCKADGNIILYKLLGTTNDRPSTPTIGYIYKDTTLNKLIVWDGNNWLNMDGSSLS